MFIKKLYIYTNYISIKKSYIFTKKSLEEIIYFSLVYFLLVYFKYI